eukprot:224800_1
MSEEQPFLSKYDANHEYTIAELELLKPNRSKDPSGVYWFAARYQQNSLYKREKAAIFEKAKKHCHDSGNVLVQCRGSGDCILLSFLLALKKGDIGPKTDDLMYGITQEEVDSTRARVIKHMQSESEVNWESFLPKKAIEYSKPGTYLEMPHIMALAEIFNVGVRITLCFDTHYIEEKIIECYKHLEKQIHLMWFPVWSHCDLSLPRHLAPTLSTTLAPTLSTNSAPNVVLHSVVATNENLMETSNENLMETSNDILMETSKPTHALDGETTEEEEEEENNKRKRKSVSDNDENEAQPPLKRRKLLNLGPNTKSVLTPYTKDMEALHSTLAEPFKQKAVVSMESKKNRGRRVGNTNNQLKKGKQDKDLVKEKQKIEKKKKEPKLVAQQTFALMRTAKYYQTSGSNQWNEVVKSEEYNKSFKSLRNGNIVKLARSMRKLYVVNLLSILVEVTKTAACKVSKVMLRVAMGQWSLSVWDSYEHVDGNVLSEAMKLFVTGVTDPSHKWSDVNKKGVFHCVKPSAVMLKVLEAACDWTEQKAKEHVGVFVLKNKTQNTLFLQKDVKARQVTLDKEYERNWKPNGNIHATELPWLWKLVMDEYESTLVFYENTNTPPTIVTTPPTIVTTHTKTPPTTSNTTTTITASNTTNDTQNTASTTITATDYISDSTAILKVCVAPSLRFMEWDLNKQTRQCVVHFSVGNIVAPPDIFGMQLFKVSATPVYTRQSVCLKLPGSESLSDASVRVVDFSRSCVGILYAADSKKVGNLWRISSSINKIELSMPRLVKEARKKNVVLQSLVSSLVHVEEKDLELDDIEPVANSKNEKMLSQWDRYEQWFRSTLQHYPVVKKYHVVDEGWKEEGVKGFERLICDKNKFDSLVKAFLLVKKYHVVDEGWKEEGVKGFERLICDKNKFDSLVKAFLLVKFSGYTVPDLTVCWGKARGGGMYWFLSLDDFNMYKMNVEALINQHDIFVA